MSVAPWPRSGFSCPPFNLCDPRAPADVSRYEVDGALVYVDTLSGVDVYDPQADGQCNGYFDGSRVVVTSRHGAEIRPATLRRIAAMLADQFVVTMAPARYLVFR